MSAHFAALTGPVTPAEAHEALSRFNASHWNNPTEHARYSIPADPKHDDDLRLGAFIEHVERLIEAAEKELAKYPELLSWELRVALANLKGPAR
jgi:hypothetical protein